MTQVKQTNPLPLGRYWLQVEKPQFEEWFEWLSDMGKSVKVTQTEEFPDHLFTLFEVKSNAAFFPAERFGFPNKADSNVKNESDVVQAPEVFEPGTEEVFQFVKTAGKVAAGLFIAKLAIDLFRKKG